MAAAALNIFTLISNDLLNKTGVHPVSIPVPVKQILGVFQRVLKSYQKVMLPLKYQIYWETGFRKRIGELKRG